MAEHYGYFNGIEYGESFVALVNKILVKNGVFDDGLIVSASSGMTVKVAEGAAIINGFIYYNDTPMDLVIPTADATLPRIDSIILRWNIPNRTMNLMVVSGSAQSNPSAPALVRDGTYYDIQIATIRVNAGVASITTADITDTRPDESVCGITSGYNGIDIDELMKQYTAEFNNWFDQIKGQLSEDAAGNLQNQINELNEDIPSPINQLLNPCFEVNQRKNTIYAEPDYTFDRWWGNGNGVITRSANTAPTASAYMLDIVTNTLVSSSGFVLSQRIEEFDSKLVGKTVSYSIWMMADTPTELSIYIGGTAVTCNVTTSWQEFKGTITVDSTTESLKKGFQVYCAGSGATLHISSPQLVFGGYSGGFQPRPYSEELTMCQRYFFAADRHHCTGAFVNADGTKIVVGIPTPATMRTLTPSVKETTGTANIRANGSVYTNVSLTNPNPTGYRGTVMMAEFNCSGLTTQKNQPAAVSIMSTLSIDAEIYD